MNNEHRHDLNQVADEEALMEAEDIAQSVFDGQKTDYLKAYVDQINQDSGKPELHQDFDDWAVNVTDKEKNRLGYYLRRGMTQMAQFYVGGLFMEYMDEIAANAVRGDMKVGD